MEAVAVESNKEEEEEGGKVDDEEDDVAVGFVKGSLNAWTK